VLISRIWLSLLLVGATAALVTAAAFAGGGQRLHIDSARAPLRLVASGTLPQLTNAVPGDRAQSLFGVRNRGSETGLLSLSLAAGGSLAARRSLDVRIERSGRVYFEGRLSSLHPLSFGRVRAGGALSVLVTVTLRRDTTRQGQHATLSARWVAVQTSS
jgi:hypothetical protein